MTNCGVARVKKRQEEISCSNDFERMSLAGRLRDQKVRLLRRLEIERIRESQEMFLVAKSERGSPRY